MSPVRDIPHAVRKAQLDAADPDVSAFVSANAGSGKTHVLAQRVINLLLGGCDPAKILCITFTKAAAANMANRVFGTLAAWTTLDDAALDERIRLSTGRVPGPAERARARRLFASALETPGGLKVQTIHAFCTRLLHQFPFEADVPPRFAVLDDATTRQLLEELTLEVLLEAAAAPEETLGRALQIAIVAAADRTFKEVVNEAIGARQAVKAWLDRAGGIDAAMAGMSCEFGIDPNETREQIEEEFVSAALVPPTEWPALIEILISGLATDRKNAAMLQAALTTNGRARIDAYVQMFCTKELAPRAKIVTAGIARGYPELAERLTAEQERINALLARERALLARERTRALITIASEVIGRYAREKERRALLDYEDLIDKTLALFTRVSAAWVLYKLDLGIDHVLIDEAQDTSPQQWNIVRAIVSEFTPGGARPDVKRTVFAVGDEKQSIFSFQGAAPRAFDEMRHVFERQFANPEQGWRYVRFHHSFRSGPAVLQSVDKVFAARDVYASITTDASGVPPHECLPDAAPGLVELWPLIEPNGKDDKEGWDAPFDTDSEVSPRVRLARRIAEHARRWTANGVSAGDILVLVQKRGPLFEAIIRALKNAGVRVAGADRLVLTEHIAVMDLMALADALLLPDDDLALACVLKSPLFGLTENQLFDLAWERKGSLRDSLRAKAKADGAYAETERALGDLARAARTKTPFAFFAEVLGPRRGRAKFLARLGAEANDALDEFLNLALDYETRETPSLQGFLDWLRKAQSEVRRDMEMARDEVRVMTVHGAKGLEAGTVVLADTTNDPKGAYPPKLLTLDDGALVWATRKADDTEAMAAARTRAEIEARDEYRRLLYVAMTRAKERLIVCGSQGDKKIPDGCWYNLVANALADECTTEPAEDGDGTVLRFRKGESEAAAGRAEAGVSEPPAVEMPAWIGRAAPPEPRPPRLLSPSLAGDDAPPRRRGAGDETALRRGLLTHRLMQALPDIPDERRRTAGEDYLSRAAVDLSGADRADIVDKVLGVLTAPRMAALFRPGSRAEVPIVGHVAVGGERIPVSGRVDRLVVTEDAVLIADFKTNRPAPRRLEAVPPDYVTQLALYRAVLVRLFPGRRVTAALVWTEVPDVMELPTEELDAALTRVNRA